MSNSLKTANWANIYFNMLLEMSEEQLYLLLNIYEGCFPSNEEEAEIINTVLEFKKTPLGQVLC